LEKASEIQAQEFFINLIDKVLKGENSKEPTPA